MTARVERGESITLQDLRLLAAPGPGHDTFGDYPVYVVVGDGCYPITDFSFVFGAGCRRVEIQTGHGLTRRELDKAQGAARAARKEAGR